MSLKYLLVLLLIGIVVALVTPSLADLKKPSEPIKGPLPLPKFSAPFKPRPPVTVSKPPHKEKPVPPLQPPKKKETTRLQQAN
ncbi:hypothetical protein ACOSQ3_006963 [Xanthoceras sorbifolium]